MMWRPKSSCVFLILLIGYALVSCCCYMLNVIVDFLLLFKCILISIWSRSMLSTQYMWLVLATTCIFKILFCGLQRVFHRLQLPSALASLQYIRFLGELFFLIAFDPISLVMAFLAFGHKSLVHSFW